MNKGSRAWDVSVRTWSVTALRSAARGPVGPCGVGEGLVGTCPVAGARSPEGPLAW